MSNVDLKPPAYLVMTNVDPQDWCVAFAPHPKIIGRAVDADVTIAGRHASVSRRHVEIWSEGNALRVRDVGSKAGTHVNGVWLKDRKEATVYVGDRIWIGGIEFQVVDDVPLIAQVLADSGIVEDDEPTNTDSAAKETFDGLARSTEFQLSKPPHPVRERLALLTQAELQIILWMGRGFMSDEELGEQLTRSPNTVRTQLNSIFRKLDLHSRTDILAFLKRGGRAGPKSEE